MSEPTGDIILLGVTNLLCPCHILVQHIDKFKIVHDYSADYGSRMKYLKFNNVQLSREKIGIDELNL